MQRTQFLKNSIRTFRTFNNPIMVKVGDKIPSTPLKQSAPDDKFDLSSKVSSGKNVILGVPAAFSGPCSSKHIPGYINQWSTFKSKGYDKLYVVAVNDPFVIEAWSKSLLGEKGNPDVEILGDPKGDFVKSLDLAFDGVEIFGNWRSKRYALLVQDGKVAQAFVEPDNISIDVSDADKVVKKI